MRIAHFGSEEAFTNSTFGSPLKIAIRTGQYHLKQDKNVIMSHVWESMVKPGAQIKLTFLIESLNRREARKDKHWARKMVNGWFLKQ